MKREALQHLLYESFGALDDKRIMALTDYGEARGEKREGQIAVGSVILERVEHRGWDGKTIQDVCLMPGQFSCFLPDDPNFESLKMIAGDWDAKYYKSIVLQTIYAIASGLIDGTIPRDQDIARVHCCQYVTGRHRRYMDEHPEIPGDRWWQRMKILKALGAHEFYCEMVRHG